VARGTNHHNQIMQMNQTMKKYNLVSSVPCSVFSSILAAALFQLSIGNPSSALGQTTPTYSSNCLAGPVTLLTASSNLLAAQYYTNRIWQGRNVGIGVTFAGGSATNTGGIGFQFGVLIGGTNGFKTTTRPFTITSTANGVTPVTDWSVLPNYTLGPADALVLLGVTNAAVNVNPVAAGSVTVSSVWIQTDTRP
jgi:hypothetical protein